VENIFLF